MNLILMASGSANRFGSNKLLQNIGNKKIFEHTAEIFLKVKSIKNRIVVSKYSEILETLQGCGYLAVKNEHSERGISESIKLGIRKLQELGQDALQEGVMFAVCDQPLLQSKTVEAMIAEFQRIKSKERMQFPILCAKFGEKRGNPVIFDAFYATELENLTGDTGGRQIIKKYETRVLAYFVKEEMELSDIDTLEDLQKICECMEE